MEFIALEKKPAAAAPRRRVYMAMLETPKGYTFLRCATPDEGFAAALPQFRALRDSLNPP